MSIGATFPEVLAAAQAGSEWAWERLYESVASGVRGYLASQGAADAENLTGEVLLQLARGLGRFVGDETAFRSWVFLVAHHRVVDERRRRSRDDELAGRLVAEPAPAAPDQELLQRLDETEWADRLARLTDEQRTVVLLRVVGGLSADEVGRVVGKRPGAVRVVQHRALSRLREILRRGVTQ